MVPEAHWVAERHNSVVERSQGPRKAEVHSLPEAYLVVMQRPLEIEQRDHLWKDDY